MANYYLKLPAPDGRSYEFVPVDVTRLTPKSLLLYSKVKSKDGWTFTPLPGSEDTVNLQIDLQLLEDVIRELQPQIEDSLAAFGEAGQLVKSEVLDCLDLLPILRDVARGDNQSAEEKLRILLYGLMGGTSTLADRLLKIETTASGISMSFDHLNATAENSDNIAFQLYNPWAESALGVIVTFQELENLERTLQALQAKMVKGQQQRELLVSLESETVRSALTNLQLGPNNFMEEAYSFLGIGTNDDSFANRVAEAKTHIANCRSAENTAQQAWINERGSVLEQLSKQKDLLNSLYEAFLDAVRRFEIYKSVYTATSKLGDKAPNVARPYEVAGGKYISRSDYELAELIVANSDHTPIKWRNRLQIIISTIERGLEQRPVLPEAVTKTLNDAQRYLAQVEEILSSKQETVESKYTENFTPSPEPATTTVNVVNTHVEPYSQQRAEYLYELLKAVGFVVTCHHSPVIKSTVKALLDLIKRMGLCSESEQTTYYSVIESMVIRPGESFSDESVGITEAWRTRSETWIIRKACVIDGIRRPKKDAIKFCLSHEPEAISLLAKHKLTIMEIKAEHVKRKEDKLQQRESYFARLYNKKK